MTASNELKDTPSISPNPTQSENSVNQDTLILGTIPGAATNKRKKKKKKIASELLLFGGGKWPNHRLPKSAMRETLRAISVKRYPRI